MDAEALRKTRSGKAVRSISPRKQAVRRRKKNPFIDDGKRNLNSKVYHTCNKVMQDGCRSCTECRRGCRL